MTYRRINKVFKSKPTLEGAGVHLKRAFGYGELPLFDPFLMLDDFRNDEKENYVRGFPWHPHRGIETITYLLQGSVEHSDSMGNKGIISSGDVQWMTAGSGIIHQEMPLGDSEGKMYGFQIWANLPAAYKMMPPRYRDIKSGDIPNLKLENGVLIKVIAGKYNQVSGPAEDIIIDPDFFDIEIPSNTVFELQTKPENNAIAYVIGGQAYFSDDDPIYKNENTLLFDKGDSIRIKTENESVRFIFLSGKPLNEPIAWGGPIVMNSREELKLAFEEYESGKFIK